MSTVGFIGSGMIGGTVAKLAVAAGHDVVLSNSRGPETLHDLVTQLGPHARAATADEVAEVGEILLVSIPLRAYSSLPAPSVRGKVVMDTGNYYPERDGVISELDAKTLTDSEYLGRHLPEAEIVKVFNNIFFKHLLNLARPAEAADRSYLPIAGDDIQARTTVSDFLDSIGYGTLDAGRLSEGWRQQSGTPAYGAPYGPFDNEQGTPAGADAVRAALDAATR
jgi:8-hydroxy-5-deazaflavin:NADPH oxidoreductase